MATALVNGRVLGDAGFLEGRRHLQQELAGHHVVARLVDVHRHLGGSGIT